MENIQKQPEVDNSLECRNSEDTDTRMIYEVDDVRKDNSDAGSSLGFGGTGRDSKHGGFGEDVLPQLEITNPDHEDDEYESEDFSDTTDDGGGGSPGKSSDDKAQDGPTTLAGQITNLGSNQYKVLEATQKALDSDEPVDSEDGEDHDEPVSVLDGDNLSGPKNLTDGDEREDPAEYSEGSTDGDGDGTTEKKNDPKEVQKAINSHISNLALWNNPTKRAESVKALQQIGQPAVSSLTNALGSRDYRTRDGAQRALEGIGEAALPSLEKALKSDDAEVRGRAERATEVIKYRMEGEDRQKLLEAASKEETKVDELLKAAHLEVNFFDTNQGVTDNGPVGSDMQLKDIARGPTTNERSAAEHLLNVGAQPTFNGDRFNQAKNKLLEQANKDGDQETARKLMKLGLAMNDGKAMFARSLSASGDPADLQRGRELVNEQLQSNPKREPSRMLSEAAAELSMDKSESFRKAYEKAGGELLDLKVFGDIARRKQAMRRQQ